MPGMRNALVVAGAALAAFAGPATADVTVPRLNTVYHFQAADYPGTGNLELSGLVQAPDGHFWGVSAYGGRENAGFVYKVDATTGRMTRVHDFDFFGGVHPRGRLALAADGWLYGTTESGGVNQADWCYAGKFYNGSGCGTLFRIATDGRFEKLHDFYSEADGYHASPGSGVVQGPDGAFYGMAIRAFPDGRTSLFRFQAGNGLASLHLFPLGAGGGWPNAGLTAARDGSLIGTTGAAGGGCGTVFRARVSGSVQTLHSFSGAPQGGSGDGCTPQSLLTETSDGVFVGTTTFGGYQAGPCIAGGCGTLFRVTASGAYSVLHRFRATAADGLYPAKAGVVAMPDGTLYGTAAGNPYGDGFGSAPLCYVGGGTTFGCGTVWRLPPGGKLTALAAFGDGNGAFGLFPMGPLVRGQDGNLVGISFAGGGWGYGTVWRWVMDPATPLVAIDAFSPPGGPPGTPVTLRGAGLAGTTQVTLGNGQAAEPIAFSVVDDTTITATVQAGAQSSAFGVTGPHGTTFSPASFILRPVIDRITPESGRPGSYVTVLGAHFDALTSITFGGVPATRYTYVTGDDTAINIQVPRRAKTGPIVVTNVGGSASSPTFTVPRLAQAGDDSADDAAATAGPPPAARAPVRCTRDAACTGLPAPGRR